MPTHYQEQIFAIDPTVNPAGVEAHMRIQFHNLDNLDITDFRTHTYLAKVTEHRHPGYMREAAESQTMTADYNHWQPLLNKAPPDPECAVCYEPVHESDAMPDMTIKELLPALSDPVQKTVGDAWQQNPVMRPLPVHIRCIDLPQKLSVQEGVFQAWTVRRLKQLQLSLDIET